jgi:putative endonuclease
MAAVKRERSWKVYFVRRADGALYCGIAKDVAARFQAHQDGRGAKALRGRGPLELAFSRRVGDRARAQRVEAALKRLPKAQKERLAASPKAAMAWFAAFAQTERAQRIAAG